MLKGYLSESGGGSYEATSPVNLQVSTFADELKMATNKSARVFAVGLKEHPAIFSAGHSADGVYWFDNTSGTFMTCTYYMDALPSWVNDFNAMNYSEAYLNSVWNLLLSPQDYYDCLPDTSSIETGFGGRNSFPYDLKKISQQYKKGSTRDFSLLRETPFGNSLTTDFALKLIENERLGQDDITDFLSICYSATDYIGHRFGPSSVEAGDAILRLDKDIEKLIKYINENLGKRNVLIYFTAAHGVSEVPGVLESYRIPAGYFR